MRPRDPLPNLPPASLAGCVGVLFVLLGASTPAHATLLGVDVSADDGVIDWPGLATRSARFGFVRATEDDDHDDARRDANFREAQQAGLFTAPYHVGRPDTGVGALTDAVKQDALDEAARFLDAVEPLYDASSGGVLRPVLRLGPVPSTPSISTTAARRAYVSAWVGDFSEAVEQRLGVRPVLGVDEFFVANYLTTDLLTKGLWRLDSVLTVNDPLPFGVSWAFEQEADGGLLGPAAVGKTNRFNGGLAMLEAGYALAADRLPGDYNDDGVVDGADYTLFRDTLFDRGSALPADGNGDGVVNGFDYDVWRDAFGETAGSGNEPLGIPEPTAGGLLLAAAVALQSRWRASSASARRRGYSPRST